MKKLSFLIGVGLLTTGMFVSSCKKSDSTSTSNSATVTDAQASDAQDNSIASAAFDNVDDVIASASSGSLKSGLVDSTDVKPDAKTTHWEKGKVQKELTFNKIKKNGKELDGKIDLTITYPANGDSTSEKTWVRTLKFNDYSEGGRMLEGTKTITYLGKVDGVHPEWEIKLDSGKITLKNGKTITFSYDRHRKQIAGDTTLTPSDDVFQINGTGSGINRRGVAYTSTSTDLIKARNCHYYKSGTTTFVTDKKTVTVTYSGGDNCDPSATVTVDGKTKTINTDTESN